MVGGKLAVVCARGGSKRIPRKNIIDFFGRPMIAWTIAAALEAEIFDRVIVSTEDEEIAEIATRHGAEIPFLRSRYFDDHSSVSDVVVDTLETLAGEYDQHYDVVAHLMPNCPLRGSTDIQHSFDRFLQQGENFQISCFEYGWMNPWWAFKVENEIPVAMHGEALGKRSQDLQKLYCPTGAIWIAKSKALIASRSFYGSGFRLCPISWQSAVDIDDNGDLEMAKAVYLARSA